MLDEVRNKDDVEGVMLEIGRQAKAASRPLAVATAERKHAALVAMAEIIVNRRDEILAANAIDLENARQSGIAASFIDRLTLTESRIRDMANGIRAIADLKDPVGDVIAEWDRPNGLHIERVRTPLGVIGVIYESRPNVTADAGALCLKAGNAVILRGGSDSFHSSRAIHACLVEGLKAAGLPEHAIQMVPVADRAAVGAMLSGLGGTIDVIVPRGGKSLVARVQNEARVPVFAHLEGLCHIYVDASADLAMAEKIVVNAKMRRTGICGAAETLLIDSNAADKLARPLLQALLAAGCEVRVSEELAGAIDGLRPATDADWSTEYLDAIISVPTGGRDFRRDRTYQHLVLGAYRGGNRRGCRCRRALLRRNRFRHPAAQCLHPVCRWRRIRHGRRDRHCHRQDARARPRWRRAADIVQVSRARRRTGQALT